MKMSRKGCEGYERRALIFRYLNQGGYFERRRGQAMNSGLVNGMNQEMVGKAVLDSAFKAHTKLGPGLLESVYEAAMAKELREAGHTVERQKPIPVYYDGELLAEVGFRADLIVDSLVLVELKSVAQVSDLFKKTTWNYLRIVPLQLGFLINFNEAHLKDGITRIVSGGGARRDV